MAQAFGQRMPSPGMSSDTTPSSLRQQLSAETTGPLRIPNAGGVRLVPSSSTRGLAFARADHFAAAFVRQQLRARRIPLDCRRGDAAVGHREPHPTRLALGGQRRLQRRVQSRRPHPGGRDQERDGAPVSRRTVVAELCSLRGEVCGIVPGGLTPTAWRTYAPGIGYRNPCPAGQ